MGRGDGMSQQKKWSSWLLITLALAILLGTAGCGAPKYKVDYCGSEFAYRNAKSSYRAGTEVKLIYELVATDTDYCFYLDGEPVDYEYENDCFIITFTMPAHDVQLDYTMTNSMLPLE